eukprot:CAMPEP_0183719564 /NCGR_PEP_ID=MMETSP0737-20130205/12441_1 /TAXON_ID=385413 /ORGANISM="Thalassiosira miniscula, Strain CCMP1093" /LENGTH=338 /DNA_ID=CAMNT_0025949283 /DNA_START=149 /DNA_END=1162 /DNA_ORIENTATION=+
MAVQKILRLRIILIALLFQLSCLGPTASFSLSPRRYWTPLQAAENAYNKDDGTSDGPEVGEEEEDSKSKSGSLSSPFEKVVRKVTGNERYKFGDITRSVVNTTTHGVEDVVRSVTHDGSYQFGDLTKKALGSTTSGFEGVVKSVTGREDYKFGDLTKGTINAAGSVMTYSEKTLSVLKDNNIHELVELLNLYWMKRMDDEERREAFTVFVYLGAIIVLSYNFVANLMSGMVFAAAWTKVSAATGVSPLSPGMWAKLIETKSTLDLFFGGPCLPARAIITIPWFFTYRRLVVTAASNSPLREKYPIINRCMSLLLSYVVGNLAFLGGVTFLMIKMLSVW